MRRIRSGCCARAPSGQTAAAPGRDPAPGTQERLGELIRTWIGQWVVCLEERPVAAQNSKSKHFG